MAFRNPSFDYFLDVAHYIHPGKFWSVNISMTPLRFWCSKKFTRCSQSESWALSDRGECHSITTVPKWPGIFSPSCMFHHIKCAEENVVEQARNGMVHPPKPPLFSLSGMHSCQWTNWPHLKRCWIPLEAFTCLCFLRACPICSFVLSSRASHWETFSVQAMICKFSNKLVRQHFLHGGWRFMLSLKQKYCGMFYGPGTSDLLNFASYCFFSFLSPFWAFKALLTLRKMQ